MPERVKWFNVPKEFVPQYFGSKFDGYSSIYENDGVGFIVGTCNGKRTKVYDVTAPGGSALFGGSRPGDDRGVRSDGGGGDYSGGAGGRGCYRCGEKGHLFRECPPDNVVGLYRIGGGGGGGGGCYMCGERAHIFRDCPQMYGGEGRYRIGGRDYCGYRIGGRDGGGRGCYMCSEKGHIFRDCPQAGGCRFCGEFGHTSGDCVLKA